jgi:hypothetical protein
LLNPFSHFLSARRGIPPLSLFPVRPTHYDLVFKTDLEELRFDGEGVVQ